jgi:mannose-1-phosphate guanylyltransferase
LEPLPKLPFDTHRVFGLVLVSKLVCNAYRRLVTGEAHTQLHATSVVILAAGRGKRLSPLTDSLPKPLLPVLNLPLLLWATARLSRVGMRDVFVNVHYLAAAFQQVAAICESYGPRLHLVHEGRPTGPLGGVISCRSKLPDSDICLILSGDALYDIDFQQLVAAHRASGSDLTLTVTGVRDGQRYGVLDIDENGFVTNMREKPRNVRPLENISCGIYVMSMRRMARLTFSGETPYDFVDLVSSMLAAGDSVFTYNIETWRDVGAPRDLLDVNLAYLRSKHLPAVASLCHVSSMGEIWTSGETTAPSGVIVKGRALLGDRVTIEPGAILCDVVVGTGATINAGARLTSSVVLMGASVLARADVTKQIVSPC